MKLKDMVKFDRRLIEESNKNSLVEKVIEYVNYRPGASAKQVAQGVIEDYDASPPRAQARAASALTWAATRGTPGVKRVTQDGVFRYYPMSYGGVSEVPKKRASRKRPYFHLDSRHPIVKFISKNPGAPSADVVHAVDMNSAAAYRALTKLRKNGLIVKQYQNDEIRYWLASQKPELAAVEPDAQPTPEPAPEPRVVESNIQQAVKNYLWEVQLSTQDWQTLKNFVKWYEENQ